MMITYVFAVTDFNFRIETCLRTVRPKLYHMGIRGGISRTTLVKANENRDWRIYADFAQVLIRTDRDLYVNDPFAVELEQTVYALDSTTNAVKTQVWIAISVFVLVAIVKKRLHLKQSLYTILQILSISVFEKE